MKWTDEQVTMLRECGSCAEAAELAPLVGRSVSATQSKWSDMRTGHKSMKREQNKLRLRLGRPAHVTPRTFTRPEKIYANDGLDYAEMRQARNMSACDAHLADLKRAHAPVAQ